MGWHEVYTEIRDYLRQEGATIKKAPLTFVLAVLLGAYIGYRVADKFYQRDIAYYKTRAEDCSDATQSSKEFDSISTIVNTSPTVIGKFETKGLREMTCEVSVSGQALSALDILARPHPDADFQLLYTGSDYLSPSGDLLSTRRSDDQMNPDLANTPPGARGTIKMSVGGWNAIQLRAKAKQDTASVVVRCTGTR